MLQFSLFFRIIQQYQINKIKMFQKKKNDKKCINHVVNFFYYFQKLGERISFFTDEYLKFWAKIEEIFPVDSTRLEPEPEKKFSPDPNPKIFFLPTRTRARTRPDFNPNQPE